MKIFDENRGYKVRVAYQTPVSMSFKSKDAAEGLPNTFEDALVYENPELFANLEGNGLIAKFRDALTNSADLAELAANVSDALKNGTKAQFALDILFSEEIDKLKVPLYIDEGLTWLSQLLQCKEDDVTGKVGAKA